MKNRGYRCKRRVNKGMLLLLLLLSAVFFVSCVAGANPLWVRGVLGVDVSNYGSERIESTLPIDGPLADSLCEMVGDLTANSLRLKTFRTPSQAVTVYRDALLNALLRDNYLLYTGNRHSLSISSGAIAGDLSTAIPAEDFERAANRYFGATSVRHKNGAVFAYVSSERVYTAPLQAWRSGVTFTAEVSPTTARLRFPKGVIKLFHSPTRKSLDSSAYSKSGSSS